MIAGVYLAPSSRPYVFINVHGLGSNRHEWAPLEKELEKRGYGFLSFDLRGHGGSLVCSGRAVDYKSFSSDRWADLSGDIAAAAGFLGKRGIVESRLIVCGASIGANLSLKAAAEGLRPAGLVLLSPGLAYAGIDAEKFLMESGGVPTLLAASKDDLYAWKSSGYLAAKAGLRGMPAVFRRGPGGHGAGMLSADRPELLDRIMDWVHRTVAPPPSSNY